MVLQSADGSRNDPPGAEIMENLKFYTFFTEPQKVYLHLDKAEYKAGEAIWFKAYLLDGIRHDPYSDTTNIYIELIHSDGNIMEMRVLLAEEGFAAGEIFLGDNMPDGNYILRAYTDWMLNFGEEYFYTRHLYINNPEFANMIPRGEVRRNRRFNRNLSRMGGDHRPASFTEGVRHFFWELFNTVDHQVAFFPEGGNLVKGTANRVAFKVADQLGHGLDAEGEIIDSNGETVAPLITSFAGIGVFEIQPEENITYTARISVNGGGYRNYELPEAKTGGYSLRADKDGKRIRVIVSSAVNPGTSPDSPELLLLVHTRGEPYFAKTFNLEEGTREISIDKAYFPSGIAHLTVFQESYRPVAERLIFINRDDALTFSSSLQAERNGDRLDMQVTVRDEMGNPVAGNFSLSAVAGQAGTETHKMDMLSYLLFDSDLKGMAEDIHEHFKSGSGNESFIDHLLLTHGWRRFDWDDVISGELPDVRIAPSRGLNIRGQLFDPAKNESLTNYPIMLEITNGHDESFSTRTGRDGNFAFTELFYEGVVTARLSTQRLPANYPPVFKLNLRGERRYDYQPGIYTREMAITSRGSDWSRQRRPSRRDPSEREVAPQLYGTPDQTIFIDYDKTTERDLYEVLRQRATGLRFEGGQIIIRGRTSLVMSNEARFMVDGIFVDRGTFLNMYPRDVERIEIFRGTSAAIFGIRGATGVILAYTRRPGYEGFKDALEFSMLGYHAPAQFYTDIVSIPGTPTLAGRVGETIHWDPELVSGDDGIINFRIPLVRSTERMMLTIEGAGFAGGVGSSEFTVEIDH
jgi:hypothetical protein